MTDLEKAKSALFGHSIALCRGENLVTDDSRGIAPMMKFIGEGRDLRGFSAADLVVGRAAAFLFIKAGISAVYAENLSRGGLELLEKAGIYTEYKNLAEYILNRRGDGICPMEDAVASAENPDDACFLIKKRMSELKAATESEKKS